MNLILTADGERLDAFPMSDDLTPPPEIQQFILCDHCTQTHVAIYKKSGIHDDGVIYALVGISMMPNPFDI